MPPTLDADLPPLDSYRSYLHLLARAQLHPGVQARLDASDIVQQTLLEAHRDRGAFVGERPAQLAGWLRRILGHNVANALRDLAAARRDMARERSLDEALARSGLDVDGWLVDDGATPSEVLAGHERLLALADGLDALPPAQSQALVLRYWHSRTLADIAQTMERSPAAVAGLLHRGLTGLRDLLCDLETA